MREGAADAHAEAAMRGEAEEVPTPTYVVECYWPEITEDEAKGALNGIARAQEKANAANRVHSLGCILVPSDGMAFFLFASPTAILVREASELIQLPFDRIVESFPIALMGADPDS
jgi:hypothetical protein